MKKWIIVLVIVGVILITAAAVLFFRKPPVSSFEECVQAGYPVQESYPEVCAAPDGKSFPNPNQQPIKPQEAP
ncbi:MAG: hypothetical protein ACREGJ_03845 [Candidatus Saccharimonadales bacterium]